MEVILHYLLDDDIQVWKDERKAKGYSPVNEIVISRGQAICIHFGYMWCTLTCEIYYVLLTVNSYTPNFAHVHEWSKYFYCPKDKHTISWGTHLVGWFCWLILLVLLIGFVGWLCWLVGWLAGWLVGWLFDWWINKFVNILPSTKTYSTS